MSVYVCGQGMFVRMCALHSIMLQELAKARWSTSCYSSPRLTREAIQGLLIAITFPKLYFSSLTAWMFQLLLSQRWFVLIPSPASTRACTLYHLLLASPSKRRRNRQRLASRGWRKVSRNTARGPAHRRSSSTSCCLKGKKCLRARSTLACAAARCAKLFRAVYERPLQTTPDHACCRSRGKCMSACSSGMLSMQTLMLST